MKISLAKLCAIVAVAATIYGIYDQTSQGVNPDWPTAIGVIAVSIGLVANRERHKVKAPEAGNE